MIRLSLILSLTISQAYSYELPKPRDWQVQVTICKAGPLISGYDNTCRQEFVFRPTLEACMQDYPSLVKDGEVVRRVTINSPVMP